MPESTNSPYQHSVPVQEIMGTMPSWITRWGITIIFMVLLSIFMGCIFIKVPETIPAKVTVDSLALMEDFSTEECDSLLSFTLTTDISPNQWGSIQTGQEIILTFNDAILKGSVMGGTTMTRPGKDLVFVITFLGKPSPICLGVTFVEGMSGTAEIIIRNRRLIDFIIAN